MAGAGLGLALVGVFSALALAQLLYCPESLVADVAYVGPLNYPFSMAFY